MKDDLAARLRALFIEELDEQLGAANEHLLALERAPDDAEQLRSLFRVMHTLKGAARSANVDAIERLCHRLESMLAGARDQSRALTPAEVGTLFAGVDQLAAMQSQLSGGQSIGEGEGAMPASAPAPRPPVASPSSAAPVAPAPPAVSSDAPAPQPPAQAAARPSSPAPRAEAERDASIRVGQDRVDALHATANRLLILAGRMHSVPTEIEQLHDAATRGAAAWRRLRRVVARTIEEGSHDLARDLEALDDTLAAMRTGAASLLRDSMHNDRDLERLAGSVSVGVRELRMRPFADAIADLPRAVRDIAAATGKQVTLETFGETVQADRAVLGLVHDALLHLVRNAVDHGLESPADRRAAGKPEAGTLRVGASLIGDRVVVTVGDDGAGLDIAGMRRQLAARGETAPVDDRQVARRLFLGGVSTRDAATAISGRGVGLDAVRAVAERLRGSIDVEWIAGKGTTFTLEAPLTLATVRAVLVRVGQLRLAIPSAFVERLVRVAPDTLRVVDGRLALTQGGAPIPIGSLAAVLGPPVVDRAPEGPWPLVLLQVGERRVALRVSELLEEAEVVVRPIHAYGRVAAPHVSGAAMLASGAIALVLNVTAAVATALGLPIDTSAIAAPASAQAARRRVLVVDDSITTRTLEASVLEAAGYDVVTAVDGADGWRKLQEMGADLVVSDVEMPRMDGLQLCETVRGSPRFKQLPFILVTALEKPEHRARGLEVGADAYLGKSSFEQEGLLTTVRDLLG